MSFLIKHYEKLILIVLLLVFVALFGYQVLAVLMESTSVSPEEEILNQTIRDSYTPLDLNDAKYDAVKAMQAGMKGEWKTKTGGAMDLLVPFPMIRCTIGRHLIPASDIEKRKPICSYCGEDLTAATRASASAAAVQKTAAIRDKDGDGMPDDWETRYQLDPKDKADALLDKDSDGFSNLEEYRAHTNPNDPKSRPSYAAKLYLREVKQEQIGVRLKYFGMASPSKNPSKWSIQLEIRNPRNPSGRRRSINKKLGEKFETVNAAGRKESFFLKSIREKWTVDNKSKVKINQSSLELVRMSDNTSIFVELQKEAIDPKQTVRLYFDVKNLGNTEISCSLGGSFTVGNDRVARDTFLIQSVDMGAGTARVRDKRTKRIYRLNPIPQGNPGQGREDEIGGGREGREMRPQGGAPERRRRGGLPQF